VEYALIIPQIRPRSNQLPSAGASVGWTAIGSRDRRSVLLHRGVIHYDYITAPHHGYLRGRYGAVVLINGAADAQIMFTIEMGCISASTQMELPWLPLWRP
jgi:hypothetical protein